MVHSMNLRFMIVVMFLYIFRYMVLCIDTAEDSLSPLNLIAASRVGSQVKKQLLLAIVSPDSMIPYYIKSNWWKGNE